MAALANARHTDEIAVKDAYYQWCNSIAKAHGDANVVTRFYSPNAILLPTLSEKILINKKDGLNAYFKKLTLLPNIKCTPKKLITRMYQGTAINSGLYVFSYMQNNKIMTIPARFTFVYTKENNQWLIIKHHSSKMPE